LNDSVSTFGCNIHVDSLLQFCHPHGVHVQGLSLVTWVVGTRKKEGCHWEAVSTCSNTIRTQSKDLWR